jgi:hypothetical protein
MDRPNHPGKKKDEAKRANWHGSLRTRSVISKKVIYRSTAILVNLETLAPRRIDQILVPAVQCRKVCSQQRSEKFRCHLDVGRQAKLMTVVPATSPVAAIAKLDVRRR